ncbi:Adhesion G protein-coupled receptor L2 [Holothuria leucospilota]|uniref:Adhesion G protein-coupled receptor L2 n=1 Tax=Holothuria leucospilota TaxID=206669 RepID=A0A9Q1C9H5_HOLLE|nr:Adhesion G protein-coupled receptor L2 [Holothuria leucospilota]
MKTDVCEDDRLELRCPEGRNLFFVNGTFGPSPDTCGGRDIPFNITCHQGSSVTNWLQREIGGLNSYSRLVTANFPGYNPCPLKKNMLHVEYQCFEEPALTAIACERTTLHLFCPASAHSGKSLTMLFEYANYGSMDRDECVYGNFSTGSSFETPCVSSVSLAVVAKNCSGKSVCMIKADNSAFGDPCHGTFKYLEVRYRCVEDPSALVYPRVPGSIEATTLQPESTPEPITHCESTSALGLDWPRTVLGKTATVHCFNDDSKTANWHCSAVHKDWDLVGPNISECPPVWVYDVESQLQNSSVPAVDIAKNVQKSIGGKQEVTPDELRRSVFILDQLLNLQREQLDDTSEDLPTSLEKFNQAMLEVGSNLLDTDRRNGWTEEAADSSSNEPLNVFDITTRMESSSLLLADRLSENRTTATFSTKNIDLEIRKVAVSDKARKKFRFPLSDQRDKTKSKMYSVDVPNVADQPKVNETKNESVSMTVLIYSSLDKLLTQAEVVVENENQSTANSTSNRTQIIVSVVMGVTVKKGKEIVTDLGGKELEFKLQHTNTSFIGVPSCVFWDPSAGGGIGDWSSEGCRKTFSNDSQTECACGHLTNFAILMDVTGTHAEISAGHTIALEIISIVGCTVSIICLALCIVIFTCIRDLRNLRTSIHRNLSFALMMAELVFLFGVNQTQHQLVCTLVAVLLHYFFLTAFAWMCLEGVQLYVMLVRVFHTNDKILPYYLVGYGLPAIIVGVAAGANSSGYGTEYYCWLSTDDGFIWSFAGPVLFIIFVNMVFLTRALRVAYSKSSSIQKDSQKNPNIKSWIKGGLTLMFLLGTTWAIGFAFIGAQTVVMAYLFTILNSLQGLFIFFFHCIGNERVQREICRSLIKQGWVPKSIKKRLMLRSQPNTTIVSTATSQYDDDSRRKKDNETTITDSGEIQLTEENEEKKKHVFFTNPLIKVHDVEETPDFPEHARPSWLHRRGINEVRADDYISNYPEPDYN